VRETESSEQFLAGDIQGIGFRPVTITLFPIFVSWVAILSAIPPLPPVIRIMSLFYFMVVTSGLAFAKRLDRAAQRNGRLVPPARR
jgi:hypothetical protein